MKNRIHHYGNVLISGMKEISRLSLLLLIFSPGLALSASAPDFWLAERGTQKIWLLGSIHVGNENMYPLSNAVMESWQQVSMLVVETDLSSTPDSQQSLLGYAMLPTGTTLNQQIEPALYKKTLSVAEQYQLAEPFLAQFKPWFVAITLQQQAIQQAGYQADLGIDHYFIELAHQQQTSVHYLETPEQQLNYLAQLGDMQDDFLDATLQQINTVNSELPALINAWKNGDKAKIQALLDDEDSSPELRQYLAERLIKERNQRWLPQLMTQTPDRTFVVVGAMHLYGHNGLLELLKQNGYQLSNINTH